MIRFSAAPVNTKPAVATNAPKASATNKVWSANRRLLEDFNAYQREYMRKRRALNSSSSGRNP